MKDVTTNLFIYSAYHTNQTPEENEQAHKHEIERWKMLGLFVESGVGTYKGQKEQVIILPLNFNAEPEVLRIAKLLHQESILHVYPDGYAELVFEGNKRKGLGTWQRSDTEPTGDYTKTKGGYYYVKTA
jgi:hypothetical protein